MQTGMVCVILMDWSEHLQRASRQYRVPLLWQRSERLFVAVDVFDCRKADHSPVKLSLSKKEQTGAVVNREGREGTLQGVLVGASAYKLGHRRYMKQVPSPALYSQFLRVVLACLIIEHFPTRACVCCF